jgi:hypothetical protein
MDLLATSTGDLDIVDGEIAFVTGQDAIAQHICFRIRACLNESRYDQATGVPWVQVIFRPGTPIQSVKFILEQTVIGTPGVLGCTLETPVIDPETRACTVTGKAVTQRGEVSFAVTVGGQQS